MAKESIKLDMKNVSKLIDLLTKLKSLYEEKEKLSAELELLNEPDLHIIQTREPACSLMFVNICKLVPKEKDNSYKKFIPSSDKPAPEPETELKQVLTNIPIEFTRDLESILLQHIKDNYKNKLDEIDYEISVTDGKIADLKK